MSAPRARSMSTSSHSRECHGATADGFGEPGQPVEHEGPGDRPLEAGAGSQQRHRPRLTRSSRVSGVASSASSMPTTTLRSRSGSRSRRAWAGRASGCAAGAGSTRITRSRAVPRCWSTGTEDEDNPLVARPEGGMSTGVRSNGIRTRTCARTCDREVLASSFPYSRSYDFSSVPSLGLAADRRSRLASRHRGCDARSPTPCVHTFEKLPIQLPVSARNRVCRTRIPCASATL